MIYRWDDCYPVYFSPIGTIEKVSVHRIDGWQLSKVRCIAPFDTPRVRLENIIMKIALVLEKFTIS
ncbi:MAG: hypothetical protein KAJ46_01750, partial [Sedimentisphaerales bacterium]|nr:hypothetical protein [Sedimentisphaerales bacterium]